MNLRKFLSFLFVLLGASKGWSSRLTSDVFLVVPKDEILKQAPRQTGRFEFAQESLTLSGDFPLELQNLSLQVAYEVEELQPLPSLRFAGRVRFPQIQGRVDRLSIDTVMEVKSGGIRARIPVKAQCRGLEIRNQEELRFQMTGHWVTSPEIGLQIEDLQWPRRQEAWRLTVESCEAAPGFAAFLQDQLGKFWVESPDLAETLKTEVNRRLQTWLKANLRHEQDLPKLTTRLALATEQIFETETAWVFGARMSLEPGSDSTKTCPLLSPQQDVHVAGEAPVETSSLQIAIPEKLIELWARCLHQQNLLARYDRGQDISGFQRLMGSRLIQFFVWPDLMRFPKTTNFQFHSFSYGGFSLRPLEGSAPGSVSFVLQTQIVSQLASESQGRWFPYMTFWTPLAAQIQFQVENSQLLIKMVGSPHTRLAYRFDSPEGQGFVSMGILESQVKEALATQSFQVDLPRLRLETLELRAVGLKRSSSMLRFDLEARRPTP